LPLFYAHREAPRPKKADEMKNFLRERQRMVREQLQARGITAKEVIEAFLKVPRERFVPPEYSRDAYADCPLPIGTGQTISQPYMVALMTQELGVSAQDRVLEIGTGSGYQAAILAEIGAKVYTIERHEELLERAKKVLSELGYSNILFRQADGTLGWPEEAPFNRIIVTAGAPHIPKALVDQLEEEGRLVIPVGGEYQQELMSVTKRKGRTVEKAVTSCIFVKLLGKDGWRE